MAEKNNNKENNNVYTCLRNEKIYVKYIPRATDMIKDPRHVLYGGLADKAAIEYVVPILRSNGAFVNVLTNDEKRFLEQFMGLKEDDLSIHKKKDNFWADFSVRLTKDGIVLDLKDPMDYIKYKVLKANSDYVADSLQALEDRPRPTYRFVMVTEDSENKKSLEKLNNNAKAYMLLGQYQDDLDVLKVILESLDGRPCSDKVKKEALLSKLQEYIASDAKMFVHYASDELLTFKVLLRNCVNSKFIYKKGDYYYLASDGSPLCEAGEDPTMSATLRYLANPKNQQLLFSLQEKVNSEK